MRTVSRAVAKPIRIFNTDPVLIGVAMALTAIPLAMPLPWWGRLGFLGAIAFFFCLLREQFISDHRKLAILLAIKRLKPVYDPGRRRIVRIRIQR